MDLKNFIEDLSSDLPAPGGGSASAVVGLLSASLGQMVSRLTLGKKGYESVSLQIEEAIRNLETLKKQLEDASNRDIEAFNGIVKSRKMPRETDEQRELRSLNMQNALREAVRSPWNIAALCKQVMEIDYQLIQIGNKNACTDAGAGVIMAKASIESALLNVRINLHYIKDEKYISEQKIKLNLFAEDVEQLYLNSMNKLEILLNGE